jgi:hypothetical protein
MSEPFAVCSRCQVRPCGRSGVCLKCRKTPGLGDMVASALSAVGITKERVSKAIGKPCGCAKRQEALNDLGRRMGIG